MWECFKSNIIKTTWIEVTINVSSALKNYWSWVNEKYSAKVVPAIIAPELNSIEQTESIFIGVSFLIDDNYRDS